MGWCWRTIAPLTKRQPRAMAQIEAALPHLSQNERRRIIAAMWEGLGRTFAEGLLLEDLMAQPERVVVEDEALATSLCDPAQTPNGVVFVSMHSGNWEALGIPMVERGLHVAGLYQAVQNKHLEADLKARRSALYRAGMISKGSDAMKRIVRILRSGNAVAMLADQRQNHRGIPVSFFGHPAPATPLPATLVLLTGARLVVGRCKRVGPVRFAIDLRELAVEPTGDRDADIVRLTSAIQAQLEAWIAERPQEWMWAHRRWSRDVLRAPAANEADAGA